MIIKSESKKLKVAAFVGIFPNITESWFIEQTVALIDLGVDIDLFAFNKGKAYHVSELVKNYDLLKKTTFLEYPKNKILRVMLGFKHLLKIIVYKPQILIKILNRSKLSKTMPVLKYLFWVAPLINKIDKYSVIHCHQGMIANKFLKIKDILELKQNFITTFYGQDSSKYIKQKGEDVYNQLKINCSRFLLMTEEMKDRFIKMSFPSEKLTVHYTGVNLNNYSYFYRGYKTGEKFRIISVGSFVEKKGIIDLIMAIKEVVSKNYCNIELNLVGGSIDLNYSERIKNLVRELQLEKYIIFKGLLPHRFTIDLFKEMHLMAQLSKKATSGDTDDLPFVLLEGQISGLPVITTNHVGIPEGVMDNKTGFVVNEGDYRQASEKIIFFITHPDKLKEFSYNAHNFVKEKFNIDYFNKNLVKFYQSLIYKK